MKNELKELATREEDIGHKKLSQEFFKKSTPHHTFFKKILVTHKISINLANDDQRDFALNLMKGCNLNSSFSKKANLRILVRRICSKTINLRQIIFF